MNLELFKLINDLAYKNVFLDRLMVLISQDMIYIYAGILVLVYLSGIIKRDRETRLIAVNSALFTSINLILAYIIGMFFYVDRPFVHHKVNLLYPHVEDSSFPSDHATVTMSTALGLNKYSKILGAILIILSFVVGVSRVYVGHHTPYDIVGTYILVFLTSYVYNFNFSNRINKVYEKVEKVLITKLGITWL